MPSNDTINEKLLYLAKYIGQLGEFKPKTYDVYRSNIQVKYAIERIVQLIVDTTLDINNFLLARAKKPAASDYFNSFIDLSECGALDQSLAFAIAPSTGLRNRLVHEYEAVNDEIVYKSIDKNIELYKRYLVAVSEFIKQN